MSQRIGIVTDTTSDIPAQLVRDLDIHIIPTNIVLDGKVYRDGIDISAQEFYQNYHQYKNVLSQPVAYEDFALIYKKLTNEFDALVFIHVLSKLSDTFAIALKVHQDFTNSHDCQVVMIDSLQCSMGYGIPVIAAARMAQEGRSLEEITTLVQFMLRNMSAYSAVPDLKYLRKGGKISGFKSLVGMAMKVKPVLAIEQGENIVKTKLFGEQKNMILAMLDIIKEDIAGRPITLAILQTAAEVSIIDSLRDVFQSEFKCQAVYDAYFSPAVGLNLGPESTGIAFYKHPLRA